MAQPLGGQQCGAGDVAAVGLAVGKAVDAVAPVVHHQRGQGDARAHGRGLELAHQDALARLDAPLHRSAGALGQAEHLREQARVFVRRGRWRQQHQPPGGQAPAGRMGCGVGCERMGHHGVGRRVLRVQAGGGVFDGAGELRQVAHAAPASAVRGQVHQHRAQAARGQGVGQRQHLARMAAPAVQQQHRGAMRLGLGQVERDFGVFKRPALGAPGAGRHCMAAGFAQRQGRAKQARGHAHGQRGPQALGGAQRQAQQAHAGVFPIEAGRGLQGGGW